MTTNQKTKIAVILATELGDDINPYEITNTIAAMDKINIGTEGSVNKEKLEEACVAAKKYLNSVTRPLDSILMEPIFKNKILIAMCKIQKELT